MNHRSQRPAGWVRWLPAGLVIVVLGVLPQVLGPEADCLRLADPAWAGDPPGDIVLAFGVGGVLTADGTLWQYRPDLDTWLTIDEAFEHEGKSTHVLPLPVPVDQILDMATWGFLVTTTNEIWLYEVSAAKWLKLKPPTASR